MGDIGLHVVDTLVSFVHFVFPRRFLPRPLFLFRFAAVIPVVGLARYAARRLVVADSPAIRDMGAGCRIGVDAEEFSGRQRLFAIRSY